MRCRRRWAQALVVMCAWWAGWGPAGAAPGVQDETQLKAAFIYRFAQFTQWPPPSQKETVYCLVAGSELIEPLQAIAVKAASTGMRLQTLQNPAQAGNCHLLVLDMKERAELDRWLGAASADSVLMVAVTPEAFRGGAVFALSVEPNGLSFRINNTEAKRRGLMLSSQVLKLAREVR